MNTKNNLPGVSADKLDIFVTYASEKSEDELPHADTVNFNAYYLTKYLRAVYSFKAEFDNMMVGNNILDIIEHGLENSKNVIVILTPEYRDKCNSDSYVNKEFHIIQTKMVKEPDKYIYVYPHTYNREEVTPYPLNDSTKLFRINFNVLADYSSLLDSTHSDDMQEFVDKFFDFDSGFLNALYLRIIGKPLATMDDRVNDCLSTPL